MKFKLLERESNGLCRIQALKDFGDVKAGDIGGYVASERNLSQDGDCWIYDNAIVCDNAIVHGNARVYDNALVCDNAIVCSDASVHGDAIVCGNAIVTKDPINILGLGYRITITDNHIQIGYKQFTLEQALMLEYKELEHLKDVIIPLIKLRLNGKI